MYVKHQQQPCPVSCVTTCIAMILNRPVEELKPLLHERYRETNLSLGEILSEYGVPFEPFNSTDRGLLQWAGLYLVAAPSLNIQAGMHQILLELDEDKYVVHDPNRGRPGIKYYANPEEWESADPLAVQLGGYSPEAYIPESWLQQVYGEKPCSKTGRPASGVTAS